MNLTVAAITLRQLLSRRRVILLLLLGAVMFVVALVLRLSLDDIEKAIAHLGPAACIDRGERIIVGFENAVPDGAKEEIKTIAQACKIPSTSFALRAWPGIPRKSNGKIDYAKVRELTDV